MSQARCSICGAECGEEIPIPGIGEICADCLMAGRFLGSSSTLRMSVAAECLFKMSATVRDLLGSAVREAESLAQMQQFDAARSRFLDLAQNYMDAGRPLLAAHVLHRTLRLPGQSAKVYEALGRAAREMDCLKVAAQHYKTAGWLAVKSGDRPLSIRVLDALASLAPDDPWLLKTRDELESDDASDTEETTCSFCGRPSTETGPLIAGSDAAICSECVKKMMKLNGG
jgi:hypothetical protein